MKEVMDKREAEIVEVLFKASETIKRLENDLLYLKARAFDLISAAEIKNSPLQYDPYPVRQQCEKLATFLSMKNSGQPEQFKP